MIIRIGRHNTTKILRMSGTTKLIHIKEKLGFKMDRLTGLQENHLELQIDNKKRYNIYFINFQ